MIRLYVQKGYLWRAVQLQKELKLKNIQLDTLGYLTSHDRLSLSHLDLAEEWLRQCDIYEANRRETADMTVLSFQQGTYMQAISFFELKQRLQTSISRLLNEVEQMRCAWFQMGAKCAIEPIGIPHSSSAAAVADMTEAKAQRAKMKAEREAFLAKITAFLHQTEEVHALRDNRDTRVLSSCLPDSLHEVTKTPSPRDVSLFCFLLGKKKEVEEQQRKWIQFYRYCMTILSGTIPLMQLDAKSPLNWIADMLLLQQKEITEENTAALEEAVRRYTQYIAKQFKSGYQFVTVEYCMLSFEVFLVN